MQSADLGVMRADELSQLAQEIFPSTPASVDASVEFLDAAAADEDERLLDDVLQRLLVRRKHGSKHSWADKGAAEEVEEGAAAGEASGDDVSHLRIPRAVDNASLLQTLAIKDALIKQMEAVMLLPPPEHSVTVGLGRKAQALVANARRREAVLACKLKALNGEVHAMRKRELQAARINRGLRRKLCDTLADVDAVALRREVRTLRADLSAALTREAALERELRIANHAMEVDRLALSQNAAHERKLRDDMDYVRRVASSAMTARAYDAMGIPLGDVPV